MTFKEISFSSFIQGKGKDKLTNPVVGEQVRHKVVLGYDAGAQIGENANHA
jgi:hypothetical protein